MGGNSRESLEGSSRVSRVYSCSQSTESFVLYEE